MMFIGNSLQNMKYLKTKTEIFADALFEPEDDLPSKNVARNVLRLEKSSPQPPKKSRMPETQ